MLFLFLENLMADKESRRPISTGLETFFTDFQDYFLNLEYPQRSIRQRLEQRP